jgi:tetratricopeptide (TPR) repeat protein
MAEETGGEGFGAAVPGVDASAAGLALGGASREKADSFLDEQRAVLRKQGLLLDLQIEDAREQHDLHVSHLRFRRFGDYAKAAMEAPELAQLRGDFAEAVRNDRIAAQSHFSDYDVQGDAITASDLARDHDVQGARAILAEHPQYSDGQAVLWIVDIEAQLPVAFVDADEEDWKSVAVSLASADRIALQARVLNDPRHTLVWPWLAYAWARTGNIVNAEALIRMTPLDCTRCLEFRGRVADISGDEAAAARWFARAVADAPSEPFAMTDWGAMFLHHGDTDGAIAKFEQATRIGPHFADPLEMWGEALMRKNRSDLALVKFEEANKYAPAWGRLHLEWGEASIYAGKPSEAQKQLDIAEGLNLSSADKRELAKVRPPHA